jgi:hypothetical protein
MLDKGQNWELFGYDMRHLGRYWLAAWRDLLWAHDSPIRQRLDEVVTLRGPDGSRCYQAGRPCPVATVSDCRAVRLPDELVLCKKLRVPVAAEAELDSMVELEVRASSPFASSDTRWGWSVVERGESHLQVALVIVSASGAMAYLGRDYDIHDIDSHEVWVEIDSVMVEVQGFGEGRRRQRYRRRLLHSAAMVALIAALLLLAIGISAAFKGAQLRQLETLAAATERDAEAASGYRALLAAGNTTIAAANEVVARYPSPHAEIARLSKLLGDDASITSFAMTGANVRLRGQAADAAEVMEQLTNEPAYLDMNPQAIIKRGDQEQFSLDFRVATGPGQ